MASWHGALHQLQTVAARAPGFPWPDFIATGLPAATESVLTSVGILFAARIVPLLDETGAPMKVQQEVIRHASIQTTVNV